MKVLFKIFTFFMLLTLLSCSKNRVIKGEWDCYMLEGYDAVLYLKLKGNNVEATLAGNFAGIECSIVLTHECSKEQYEKAKVIIKENNGEYIGKRYSIDKKTYPDLSMYIPFVFSQDELHELWEMFGLEEHIEY